MEKEELQKLFKKYHEGKCTETEKALLEAWYLKFNEQELDISRKRIKAIGQKVFGELPGNHNVFIKIGIKIALAAGIIGLMITLAVKSFLPVGKEQAASTTAIRPGGNAAILTLSDGQQINLSSAINGHIAKQADIQIYKTKSGQITYTSIAGPVAGIIIATNKITTLKGGQWQIALPDGSKVLLNSASSLSYPTSFKNHKNRIVRLTGEGYFEVAKDRIHPFVVNTDKQSVTVLGTHFNINSYKDEPNTKTTLQEGSIKISEKSGQTKFLSPGQQAILTGDQLSVVNVNTEEALAWKSGYFRFNDENIESIMRQLSRWYNIEVSYGSAIPTGGLNGKISRYKDISQVLKALEATQIVHFKIEGRRITVMK